MKSPEIRLAVACCRHAFAGSDGSAVRVLVAKVDWSRFTRIARFHRVQALVWDCLASLDIAVPPQPCTALRGDAEAIAVANLRTAVECRDLRSSFEDANVALLFVKGLTLGALAYPNPMLKMGWDIDLLIDRAQLDDAAALLRDRGYQQVFPGPSANLQSWHRLRKESVWSRDDGLHVELHTRLADQLQLIPGIDVHSPKQEVKVAPGITLPTLYSDELFAYLCVHGVSSLWFRLKWITDVAAFLSRLGPQEIERLYRRSLEFGAGRSSALALLLADWVYDTVAGNPDLRSELKSDRTTRWLLSAASRQLAGRVEPAEPTAQIGGTLAIHYTQFLLLPGLRFKLAELIRQARTAFL